MLPAVSIRPDEGVPRPGVTQKGVFLLYFTAYTATILKATVVGVKGGNNKQKSVISPAPIMHAVQHEGGEDISTGGWRL